MLRDEAMIVRLHISQWTAIKLDKRVTREVAQNYGVDADVGRYRKVLVVKDAVHDITRAVSDARGYHYKATLPWDDDGGRILPAAIFMEYSKKMREFKQTIEQAAVQLESEWPDYVQEAESRLKGMFNPSEYPKAWEISGKYSLSMDIEPVPVSEDFRVNIQDGDAKRIRKEIEQRVAEREGNLTKDLFLRLNKVIGHFSDKLKDDEAIFRDSLVENVVELVQLLPKLNVNGDPELAKLGKETQKKLCAYEPEQLRKDEKARAKAVGDADAILKKMAGYIG